MDKLNIVGDILHLVDEFNGSVNDNDEVLVIFFLLFIDNNVSGSSRNSSFFSIVELIIVGLGTFKSSSGISKVFSTRIKPVFLSSQSFSGHFNVVFTFGEFFFTSSSFIRVESVSSKLFRSETGFHVINEIVD